MENFNTEKIYFVPGDIVVVRHDITNKPEMVVKGKETRTIKHEDASHFMGIRCFWFTKNQELQEAVFSTKDLIHLQ